MKLSGVYKPIMPNFQTLERTIVRINYRYSWVKVRYAITDVINYLMDFKLSLEEYCISVSRFHI